jgi:hypothetical protein
MKGEEDFSESSHPGPQVTLNHLSEVMAGLVPAIYVLLAVTPQEDVDARDKRGHDGGEVIQSHRNTRQRQPATATR